MANMSDEFGINPNELVCETSLATLKSAVDVFKQKHRTYGKAYSAKLNKALDKAVQDELPELDAFDDLATSLAKSAQKISNEGITFGEMSGKNAVSSILSGMQFNPTTGNVESPSQEVLNKMLDGVESKVKNKLGDDWYDVLQYMRKLRIIFETTQIIKILLLISNTKDCPGDKPITLEEFSQMLEEINMNVKGDIDLSAATSGKISEEFSKVFNMLVIVQMTSRSSVMGSSGYDPSTYEQMNELLSVNKYDIPF